VLEYPPNSWDLDPNDLFLFLEIKEILKGKYFHDIGDIRSNMTAALKVIPQNKFQNYFRFLALPDFLRSRESRTGSTLPHEEN
jgi:hypothetical protein